jgi:hypothetical protein
MPMPDRLSVTRKKDIVVASKRGCLWTGEGGSCLRLFDGRRDGMESLVRSEFEVRLRAGRRAWRERAAQATSVEIYRFEINLSPSRRRKGLLPSSNLLARLAFPIVMARRGAPLKTSGPITESNMERELKIT